MKDLFLVLILSSAIVIIGMLKDKNANKNDTSISHFYENISLTSN